MNKHSMEVRQQETGRILQKYPDRVPVFCQPNSNKKGLPVIDKNKFLVPKTNTLAQFTYIIRDRIKIKPEQAIFLTINEQYIASMMTFAELYDKFKSDDGFLYIYYSAENVFG